MKVSMNAFIAEVRRHFGKYSPANQSRMLFKFSLAMSVFALALISLGIFVDQFHSEDPTNLTLSDGLVYNGPGIIIGHSRLKLTYPECDTPERSMREDSVLFSHKGVSFQQLGQGPIEGDEVYNHFLDPGDMSVSKRFFGSFSSFARMSIASKAFAWAAFGLQALSVILSIWTRTPPASFMTHTPIFNHSDSQRVWGTVHHALTVLAAICLLVDLAIVSVYLDLVVGRIIELSFELCNFHPGLSEFDLLKLFGRFMADYSDVDGITGSLYRLAATLTLVQTTFVFFLGTDQVRSQSATTGYSLPASKLRQLPWFCSIWRLRWSVLFFVCGVVFNQAAALYSRSEGYPLNLYAFESIGSAETGTGSTVTGTLSDFLMDITANFYVSETVSDAATLGTVPLVLALAVGSTDPHRFISKLVQLLGIIFFSKGFFSISTLVPTPASVISRPYCYDPPEADLWSLRGFFSRGAQCNHLMFSLPAALCTLSLMVIMMYMRYGPSLRRGIAYVVLFVLVLGCLMLPVAARVNYTSNVLVAFFFIALLVVAQSGAFKLLFRFESLPVSFTAGMTKLRFKPGEVLNDKIIPTIAECVRRIQMYTQATAEAPALRMAPGDLQEVLLLYRTVGDAVRIARVAKPAEKLSSAGFVRAAKPLRREVETPDEPVEDLIDMMLHNNSRQPGKEVEATPVLISISPKGDLPQSEPVIQYEKEPDIPLATGSDGDEKQSVT